MKFETILSALVKISFNNGFYFYSNSDKTSEGKLKVFEAAIIKKFNKVCEESDEYLERLAELDDEMTTFDYVFKK